jgi:hypothetical protein
MLVPRLLTHAAGHHRLPIQMTARATHTIAPAHIANLLILGCRFTT